VGRPYESIYRSISEYRENELSRLKGDTIFQKLDGMDDLTAFPPLSRGTLDITHMAGSIESSETYNQMLSNPDGD
jgi:hypothetical protein